MALPGFTHTEPFLHPFELFEDPPPLCFLPLLAAFLPCFFLDAFDAQFFAACVVGPPETGAPVVAVEPGAVVELEVVDVVVVGVEQGTVDVDDVELLADADEEAVRVTSTMDAAAKATIVL